DSAAEAVIHRGVRSPVAGDAFAGRRAIGTTSVDCARMSHRYWRHFYRSLATASIWRALAADVLGFHSGFSGPGGRRMGLNLVVGNRIRQTGRFVALERAPLRTRGSALL